MKLLIAMLLLAVVSGAQADGLGRLFFTPEQRAQLEYRHARNASGGNPPSILMLNGIVQRRGGPRTVWINGAAQDSARGGDPATETIAVSGMSTSAKIKVGEKLFPDAAAPQAPPSSTE